MNTPLATRISSNPLLTRADMQQCVRDLFTPLKSCFSPGAARVRAGASGAVFSITSEELEGFARPLWGLAPLGAGGGEFDDWALYRKGLANGSDPSHSEYWGVSQEINQRLVEYAAIGFTLLLAPDQAWTPLSGKEQANLATWLDWINHSPLPDNNWHFFRVLTNLGLANVGAPHNPEAITMALDRLEEFYLDHGWYEDGPQGHCDYYVPFAFHFYSLIYAAHAGAQDPARSARFKERAATFADEFIYFFAPDGAALPYGRSLTYRFAQSAFWGALAYAGVEVMDWGVVKGLLLRNLRWWLRQPIFDSGGLLTIGYAYPNLYMSESYNSCSSPYWAMKAFLPLALPESHPFWQAEEKPLPVVTKVRTMKEPGMSLCRNESQDHVVAFVNSRAMENPRPWDHRQAADKYKKFAYSTHFAFSIPVGQQSPQMAAQDSMLSVSEDGTFFRARKESIEVGFDGDILYSKWRPWPENPDVEIETWLVPGLPWHVRVHRLRTARKLITLEHGFAIDCSGDDGSSVSGRRETGPGFVLAEAPTGTCGLRDLRNERTGEICFAEPNTNLQHPRTRIPCLRGEHPPGEYRLACAVFATNLPKEVTLGWQQSPLIEQQAETLVIKTCNGETLLKLG